VAALFFSLAGTGYAVTQLPRNSVGSDQVRDGSLARRDFKAGAMLRGLQGSIGVAGSQGPTGPQGATGATGAQGGPGVQGATGERGPQGSTGPAGGLGPAGTLDITEADSDHVTVPAGGFMSAEASCPAGKRVVGGGYRVEDPPNAKLVPTSGYPAGAGSGQSAWHVSMQNLGDKAQNFSVLAFCAAG
jgi:hypothetical protein